MNFYLIRAVCLTVFLFKAFYSYCNHTQDSLISMISKARNSKEKVQLLNDLSRTYFEIDYNKSIQIARNVLNIAKKEKYNDGIIDAYRIIGYSYYQINNYTESLKNYFCATTFFENKKDKTKLLKTYSTIALIYNNIENTDLTLKYNNKAYSLLNEISDREQLFKCLALYARSYFLLKKYDKVIMYAKKSIEIGDKGKLAELGITNGLLGSSFWYLNNYDSALKYYNRHLEISKQLRDSTALAIVYCNIGTCYFSKGYYNKAISFYTKSISINQPFTQGHTYLEYVDVYLALKNIERATFYFNLAKADKTIDLNELYDGCKAIRDYYQKNGLASDALLYADAMDSISKEITKGEIANSKKQVVYAQIMNVATAELLREELQEQKKTNKLEKERAELLKEQAELQSRYNTLLIFAIGVLIVAFVLTFFQIRNYFIKRADEQILEVNNKAKGSMGRLQNKFKVFDEIIEINKEQEERSKSINDNSN